MPLLKVYVTARSNSSASESIAQRLNQLTAQHLKKDPALTAVIVTFVEPLDWWVGHQNLAQQSQSSFAVDIKVTAGTNTKVEMARYVEAVFSTMKSLLGQVDPTSYVIVDEVPAAAWGYGGATQEHRFVAGELAAV